MHDREDRLLVNSCVGGEAGALAKLREKHHAGLCLRLIARGATQPEAEDILGDLWSDCLPGRPEAGSLLEKYHGRGPL